MHPSDLFKDPAPVPNDTDASYAQAIRIDPKAIPLVLPDPPLFCFDGSVRGQREREIVIQARKRR